jgi:CRISPR-associated protein Csm3
MAEFNKMELITLEGEIDVITGLHIGASNDTVQIGGIDSAVIRDPRTGLPYIPGSSIKGKLRSLAEWSNPEVLRRIQNAKKPGEPCSCGRADCPVCVVFGATRSEETLDRGPTRLIVRDAVLKGTDFEFEDKVENMINRIKGTAEHPRHIERIAPGAEFLFSISFRILREQDRQLFSSIVLTSMDLLEKDYLGGNGSRGYGRIEFKNLMFEGKLYDNLKDLMQSI